jgi:hypothetical protein
LCTTQRPSLIVALVTMALHVVGGLGIQRRNQYAPRSRPRDLVRLKKAALWLPILHCLQHRWLSFHPDSKIVKPELCGSQRECQCQSAKTIYAQIHAALRTRQ